MYLQEHFLQILCLYRNLEKQKFLLQISTRIIWKKQERFARETLTQTKFRLRFRQQQTEERRHLKMRVIS